MKKIILLFLLIMNLSFSLEILSIDPLNFGTVVAGDRQVSLKGIGVYVEGKSGRKVEIIVPKTFNLEGNTMTIKVKEKQIRLNDRGNGRFILDIDLRLESINKYETLTDNLIVKVKYVD